jgi:hypothetical protein
MIHAPWASMRRRVDNLNFGVTLFFVATASQVEKNFRAAIRDALRIQDRFVPEPLFAKTGRGYLKSEGIATLKKIKVNLRRKSPVKAK